MLIRPTHFEELCPNCHLSFGTKFVIPSYAVFSEQFYTDGYCEAFSNLFFTKCPNCKKFFSREYFISQDRSLPNDKKLKSPNENLIGKQNLLGLQTPSFWRNVIKNGLFYPSNVPPNVRDDDLKKIYCMYWQCCNHTKNFDKNSPEYLLLVKKIVELFNSDTDADKLIRAEAYRNIGEFDKSLEILKNIDDVGKHLGFVYTITKACKDKIRDVLEVIEPDERNFRLKDKIKLEEKIIMVLELQDCKFKRDFIDRFKIFVVNLPEEYPEEIFNPDKYYFSEKEHADRIEMAIVLKKAWNQPNEWCNIFSLNKEVMYHVETQFCLRTINCEDKDYFVVMFYKGKLMLCKYIEIKSGCSNLEQLNIYNAYEFFKGSPDFHKNFIVGIDNDFYQELEKSKKKDDMYISYFKKYQDKLEKMNDKNKMINVLELNKIL